MLNPACGGGSCHTLTAPGQRSYEGSSDLHIAVLIDGLNFSCDTCFAIDFIFFGDGSSTGNHIIEARHALKAHTKLAQRQRSNIITEQLPYKTHNQHTVSDNATGTNHFADLGISMQGVEVARCSCIAHQA